MRAKREGMQRNACVALGNLGESDAVPALLHALRIAAPVVRSHAAWALGRIADGLALAALRDAAAIESNEAVLSEIRQALADAEPAYSLS